MLAQSEIDRNDLTREKAENVVSAEAANVESFRGAGDKPGAAKVRECCKFGAHRRSPLWALKLAVDES